MRTTRILISIIFVLLSVLCEKVIAQDKLYGSDNRDFIWGDQYETEFGPGEIDVEGNCTFMESCTVKPGTIFNFKGEFTFTIAKGMSFEGGKGNDSIIFKSDVNGSDWGGIIIQGGPQYSVSFEFCEFNDVGDVITTSNDSNKDVPSTISQISNCSFNSVRKGVLCATNSVLGIVCNNSFVLREEGGVNAINYVSIHSDAQFKLINNTFSVNKGDNGFYENLLPNINAVTLSGEFGSVIIENNIFNDLFYTGIILYEISADSVFVKKNDFLGLSADLQESIEEFNTDDYKNVAVWVLSNEGVHKFTIVDNRFSRIINPFDSNSSTEEEPRSPLYFSNSLFPTDIYLTGNEFDTCGGPFRITSNRDYYSVVGGVNIDKCNQLVIDDLIVRQSNGLKSGFLICDTVENFVLKNSYIKNSQGIRYPNIGYDPIGFAKLNVRNSFVLRNDTIVNKNEDELDYVSGNFNINLVDSHCDSVKVIDCVFDFARSENNNGGVINIVDNDILGSDLNHFELIGNRIEGLVEVVRDFDLPASGGFISLDIPNRSITNLTIKTDTVNYDQAEFYYKVNSNGGFANIICRKIINKFEIEENILNNIETVNGDGGAFYFDVDHIETDMVIHNNTINNCISGKGNGGVFFFDHLQSLNGSLNLTQNQFNACHADSSGGVIFLTSDMILGDIDITGVANNPQSFFDISANNGDGGAVYIEGKLGAEGSILINHNDIGDAEDNEVFCTANGDGGWLYLGLVNEEESLNQISIIDNDVFNCKQNFGENGGGAIYLKCGNVANNIDIKSNTVAACGAEGGNGGFLALEGSSIKDINIISNLKFKECSSYKHGGAIYLKMEEIRGILNICGESEKNYQQFISCSAGNENENGSGGGIYIEGSLNDSSHDLISIQWNFIKDVSAAYSGGWLYCDIMSYHQYEIIEKLKIINNKSSVELMNLNNSGNDGGIIYLKSGSITKASIKDNEFNYGKATSGDGGTIYLNAMSIGSVGIVGNSFKNFIAGKNGGAIAIQSKVLSDEYPLLITGNTIQSCEATLGKGGWLYMDDKNLNEKLSTFNGITFFNNKVNEASGKSISGECGSVLYVEAANVTASADIKDNIVNTSVSGKDDIDLGGAIAIDCETILDINIVDNTVLTCSSSGNGGFLSLLSQSIGGGIYVETENVNTPQTFGSCTSQLNGGAIYIKGNLNKPDSVIRITKNSITKGNSANSGGWMYLDLDEQGNNTSIIGSLYVAENNINSGSNEFLTKAGGDGGAIFLKINEIRDSVSIFHNTVSDVMAENFGGFISLKMNTIKDLIIRDNEIKNASSKKYDGGAFYIDCSEGLGISGDMLLCDLKGNDLEQKFISCTAGGNGGVLALNTKTIGGEISVSGTSGESFMQIFDGCKADNNGGGIYINTNWGDADSKIIDFNNNKITGCQSTNGNGGWLYLQINDLTTDVIGSFEFKYNFVENTTASQSGGIAWCNIPIINDRFDIETNTIKYSKATTGGGGAIYLTSNMVKNVIFEDNKITGGSCGLDGGVFCLDNNGLILNSLSITDNCVNNYDYQLGDTLYASRNGGFLHINAHSFNDDSDAINISGNTFKHIRAKDNGGALSIMMDSLNGLNVIGNTTIEDCIARNGGGGFLHIDLETACFGDIVLSNEETNYLVKECSAGNNGGVYSIEVPRVQGSIILQNDSDITFVEYKDCNAANFGGIAYFEIDTIVDGFSINGVTINNCSAGSGGSVYLNAELLNDFDIENVVVDLSISTVGDGGFLKANITYGQSVNVTEGAFSNCAAASSGGAFSINGQLSNSAYFASNEFEFCHSGISGGVTAFGSELTPFNGNINFFNNTFDDVWSYNDDVAGYGGAIYALGDNSIPNEVLIESCSFANDVDNDIMSYQGGAVNCSNLARVEITKTHFSNYNTISDGGAIKFSNVNIVSLTADTLYNCNSSDGGGGAIHISNSSNCSMESSLVAFSSSALSGGALYLDNIENIYIGSSFANSFIENKSMTKGGAIFVNNPSENLNIKKNVFLLNRSKGTNDFDGGGSIYISNDQNVGSYLVRIHENNFFYNESEKTGGAIALINQFENANTNLDLYLNNFIGNHTEPIGDNVLSNGGAVSISGNNDSITSTDNRYYDNYAYGNGGAIYFKGTKWVSVRDIYSDNAVIRHSGNKPDGMSIYGVLSGNNFLESSSTAFYSNDPESVAYGNVYLDNQNQLLSNRFQNCTFYNLYHDLRLGASCKPDLINVNSSIFFHSSGYNSEGYNHFPDLINVNYSFTQGQDNFSSTSSHNEIETYQADLKSDSFILKSQSVGYNTGDSSLRDMIVYTEKPGNNDSLCDMGLSGGPHNDFYGGPQALRFPNVEDVLVVLSYNNAKDWLELKDNNSNTLFQPDSGLLIINSPQYRIIKTNEENTFTKDFLGIGNGEFSCYYIGWFPGDSIRCSQVYEHFNFNIDNIVYVGDQLVCSDIIKINQPTSVEFKASVTHPDDTDVLYQWFIINDSTNISGITYSQNEDKFCIDNIQVNNCDSFRDSITISVKVHTLNQGLTVTDSLSKTYYFTSTPLITLQSVNKILPSVPEYKICIHGNIGETTDPNGETYFVLKVDGEPQEFSYSRIFVADLCLTEFTFYNFSITDPGDDIDICLTIKEGTIHQDVAYENYCPELTIMRYDTCQTLINATGLDVYNVDPLVFPSPFDSYIVLQIPSHIQIANVSIIDVTGNLVFSEMVNSQTHTIDTQTLCKGVYILTIESKEYFKSFKIVK